MSHYVHIISEGLTDCCTINVASAEFFSVTLDAGIGVDVLHFYFQNASDEVFVVIS